MNVEANWWENPHKFVDPENIEKMGKGAIELLRDLITARPTEFITLRRLFLRALKTYGLTWKQSEALFHARVARDIGVTESVYVSQHMGMHRDNARRLLNRAYRSMEIQTLINSNKTVGYEPNMNIYDDARVKIDIDPTERDRIVAGVDADCPLCGALTKAHRILCYECSQTYGATLEEWRDNLGYDYYQALRFLKNTQLKNARADATHDLFQQQLKASLS